MNPSFKVRKMFMAAAFRAQAHKAEKNKVYSRLELMTKELDVADKLVENLSDSRDIDPRNAVKMQLKINQIRQRIEKLKIVL